jgi:ABC-2 type transport system ATP-binding protein
MIKDSTRNDPSPKIPAIEASGLSKIYSEGVVFKKRFQALSDVSFQVNQGEVFGLLGPNGAGKTTFIKILLGIIRKSAGSAELMGLNAGSRSARRLVGYLPEHLRIPSHLTGFSALECYGNLSNIPTSEIRKKQDRVIELVGLTGRANDRCRKYSKGMLQKLGLAQALLHNPKLLILDEPTDGLDPRARADVRNIIRNLKSEGVTIFLNSHILQEVEMICDRVAILNQGILKYCGPVAEIGEFVQKLSGADTNFITMEMEISGDPTAIHQSMEGEDFSILSKSDTGTFTVKVNLANQEALDALIDQIRGQGVSLLRMKRQESSLEDAFLKIVSE